MVAICGYRALEKWPVGNTVNIKYILDFRDLVRANNQNTVNNFYIDYIA